MTPLLNKVPDSSPNTASAASVLSAAYSSSLRSNLLTPGQFAKLTETPLPTVYLWLKNGRLPAVRYGGRYLIDPASVSDILQNVTPYTK